MKILLLVVITTAKVVADFVFTPPPSSTTPIPKTSKTDSNTKADSELIIDLKSLKPATQKSALNLKKVVKDTVALSSDKTPVEEEIYQKELFQLYDILQQIQNDSAKVNETFAKRLIESTQQNQPHIIFPHTIDDRSWLFRPTFQSFAPPFQTTFMAPELDSRGSFLQQSPEVIPFENLYIGHGVNSHLQPFRPSPILLPNSFDPRHLSVNSIIERNDPFLPSSFAPNSLRVRIPDLGSNDIFSFSPNINGLDHTTVPSHLAIPDFNQVSPFPPRFIPKFPVTNQISPASFNSIHPPFREDNTVFPSNPQWIVQPNFPSTVNQFVQPQQGNLDIPRQRHGIQVTTHRNNLRNNLQNDKNNFISNFQTPIRQNQGSTRHQQMPARQSSTDDDASSTAPSVNNHGRQPQQNSRPQNQNMASPVFNDQWILQQLQPNRQFVTQRLPSSPQEFPLPSTLTNRNHQGQNTHFNNRNINSQQRNDEMLTSLLATLNRQKPNTAINRNTNNDESPNQQFNDDDIALALSALVRELQQSPNTVTRRNGNPSLQNTHSTNNVNVPSTFPTSANQGPHNVHRGNINNLAQQRNNPRPVSAWPANHQQVRNGVWTNNAKTNPSTFTRSSVPSPSRIGDDTSAHEQPPANNNRLHFIGTSAVGGSTSPQQRSPTNSNRFHFQGTSTVGGSTSPQQQSPANSNRFHFQGISTVGGSTFAQLPSPANNNRFPFQGTNAFHGNTAEQPSTNRGQFWAQQFVPMTSQGNRINTGIPDQFGNVRILTFEVPEAARVSQSPHQAFQLSPLNILSNEPTFLLSETKNGGTKATAEKMLVPEKTDPKTETSIILKKDYTQNGDQTSDSNA